MKAYVLEGIGRLNYKDVPMPELNSGWALVKVEAAGICGSDIPRIFETGTYHFPTVPGHEFAGRVADVCDEKDRAWIGRRVGVFPLIPCQECLACREEQYEMCRNYDYLGSRRDGGFAEFAAVPVWNLIELPDGMRMEAAAMLEPASVALHAVRRLKIAPGDTAALFGLGTIGLIAAQWLRIFGVRTLYAAGHHKEHGMKMKQTAHASYEYLDAGGKEGDREVVSRILEATGGAGVSIAIDCAGTNETLANCLNCVKPGGQVLAVGNPKGDMALEKEVYWKLLRKQLRVTGTWNSSFCHDPGDDWHTVIDAYGKGTLHLTDLITHRFAFDQLKTGLAAAKERIEYQNKIMIVNEHEVRHLR